MRRLYFMLPDKEITNTVVDELLLKRIDDHHIHVVAKEGTPMGDLPEANLLQKSDFIPAVERDLRSVVLPAYSLVLLQSPFLRKDWL